MELKDYYTILELPPSANTAEVKKAYRRMALQYHPDKNGGDEYAASRFAIIKEAYEVLTNPAKKELYLQQRWYAKSAGTFKSAPATTPPSLLTRLIELERHVSRMDAHRLDKQGLADDLGNFITGKSLQMLNSYNDHGVNDELMRLVLAAARNLKHDQQLRIYEQVSQLRVSDNAKRRLELMQDKTFRSKRWARLKIWVLVLTVAAICGLIYLAGR